jgi:hypothetical protein
MRSLRWLEHVARSSQRIVSETCIGLQLWGGGVIPINESDHCSVLGAEDINGAIAESQQATGEKGDKFMQLEVLSRCPA